MASVYTQNYGQANVPDRAGQLIITRMRWPVTVQANGDKAYVGFLPAGCKLHIPDCQFIGDGVGGGAGTIDVCVGSDSNVILDNQAIVASTFVRAALTTYSLAETLGVSSDNRDVYFKLDTAPTVAGGYWMIDLAYFALGFAP